MDDELQLTLLGKPEVTRGGAPVTGFVYRKSLALLCYLAVTGRSHTREALAGLLWGEATEANARAGLRKALADLRRLVAPHLTITHHEVAFNRACPYWLDVEVFERQAGETMIARERDTALTDERAAALAAAVELYQGDFLAGFYVRYAPAFEGWVLLERERLRLSALRALHTLAAHYTARGAIAQGIAYTGRVLALEPGQEEAHRQMMSLLALSGQRGAALRQYKTCRRVLAAELDVEPEEETTALYERIRDGVEPDARTGAPQHNLPASVIPLIGREKELAGVVARLRDPACRLLTLVGPGGSGKTRLAIEAALRLAKESGGDFEDGIYLISLAPLHSVEAIVHTMAQSLGFFFYEESNPRQQLLDYIRQKDMLLIMDSFEHLLAGPERCPDGSLRLGSVQATGSPRRLVEGSDRRDGADLVRVVVETAPGVKILATSRARLNLQAEHLFPIAGMDFPPLPSPTSPPKLRRRPPPPAPPPTLGEGRQPSPPKLGGTEGGREGQHSAVQLFVSSARRVRPDLGLTADDLASVGYICRLVEGMPLAILLAADWARILTPAEIAARLSGGTANGTPGTGRGLDLLETDWHDVPARQRSMRAVFDRSWDLLTEREQEVMAALSVFRGGFTHEAARRVSGASLRELMALADQSLLHRVAVGRYGMDELLRQYAEEKLETGDWPNESGQSPVHDRHSAYFAARLQEWAADLKSARQQAALAEMDVEITNARAAWDWAVARGEVARVDEAMEGLCLFYELRKRYQEGESACRAVVQRFTSPTPLAQSWRKGEADRILAKALAWQSGFSDPERASQLLQESLALLDDSTLAGQNARGERAFALFRMAYITARADRE